MKILFYISSIYGGGAGRVMVNVANGMAGQGHAVVLVTNFPAMHEYALSEKIRRYNLEDAEYRGSRFKKNYTRIAALRKILREEEAGVCVSFMGENNFRLLLARAGIQTRVLVSVRNDPRQEYVSVFSRCLAKTLYRFSDGVVFQTREARRFFPRAVQKKSAIIFNPVEEKFYQEAKPHRDGEYLLACGRLCKQKNYPMLLHAFAEVLKRFPGERLRIYGEGEELPALSDLTARLGLSDAVRFMGYSQDMPSVYRGAKLLLLGSDYEGLPNVLMEALASSLPVVSTDCPCGGPRMLLKSGYNGFLVETGNAARMAEAVSAYLALPVRERGKMRENAFASAQRFKSTAVLAKWDAYIRSMAGAAGAGGKRG